jgi:hypothetical protein
MVCPTVTLISAKGHMDRGGMTFGKTLLLNGGKTHDN